MLPIQRGEKVMKFLKIENNKGLYTVDSTNWISIDEINKDDMLILLNSALNEDFEMDDYDQSILGNPAHQIIYKQLYEKLTDLNANKSRFKDESESLYKETIEKYRQ